MPTAYLLNLTFDLKATNSSDGLFNHSTDDPTSKMWYQAPNNWPGGGLNPGDQVMVNVGTTWPPTGWSVKGSDNADLICGIGDTIFVRFAYRNWSDPNKPVNLRFAATFGRNPPDKRARICSPFLTVNEGSGVNSGPQALLHNNGTLVSGGWIFYLGQVAQNVPGGGAGAPGTYPYSFIVSAGANQGPQGNYREYGHDPKIVVTGPGGPLP